MKKTASHLQGQAKPSGPILLACFLDHLILSPDIQKEIAKDIGRNKRLRQSDMLQI